MEENLAPLLLSVVERREYTFSINGRVYWYLMDSALWRPFYNLHRKSLWKGFNFVKKHSEIWRRVSL